MEIDEFTFPAEEYNKIKRNIKKYQHLLHFLETLRRPPVKDGMVVIPKKFKLKGKLIDCNEGTTNKKTNFDKVYEAVLAKRTASHLIKVDETSVIKRLITTFNIVSNNLGLKYRVFLEEWTKLQSLATTQNGKRIKGGMHQIYIIELHRLYKKEEGVEEVPEDINSKFEKEFASMKELNSRLKNIERIRDGTYKAVLPDY
ncbi:hypothetical protein BC833DRAFT_662827 [Globomyces pollinis-pini]|nr:hypothetical protein BC833DRAFT_662827 [Globomyces pollinis-pini]